MGTMNIPKTFITDIVIPFGPFEGNLAHSCPCGRHLDPEGGGVWLAQVSEKVFWFIHNECVQSSYAQIQQSEE